MTEIRYTVGYHEIVVDPDKATYRELSEDLDLFKAKAGRYGLNWTEAVMVHMLLHEMKRREEEEDYALENPEVMTDVDRCPFCGTFLDGGRGGKTLMHPRNGCIIEGTMFSDDLLSKWKARSGQEARE